MLERSEKPSTVDDGRSYDLSEMEKRGGSKNARGSATTSALGSELHAASIKVSCVDTSQRSSDGGEGRRVSKASKLSEKTSSSDIKSNVLASLSAPIH